VAQRLGIHLSNIEPGAVNTEFVTNVKAKLSGKPSPGDDLYQPMLDSYMAGAMDAYKAAQSGEDIAKVIVEAATAATPHFRYVTSEWVRGVASRKYTDPTGDSIVTLMGSRLK